MWAWLKKQRHQLWAAHGDTVFAVFLLSAGAVREEGQTFSSQYAVLSGRRIQWQPICACAGICCHWQLWWAGFGTPGVFRYAPEQVCSQFVAVSGFYGDFYSILLHQCRISDRLPFLF